MSDFNLAEFEAEARRAGFDDVVERHWPPGYTMGSHAHDYAIRALVVQGSLWLTVGERTLRCRAGDRFELDAGQAHAEGSDAQGARFWAARRHPVTAKESAG